MNDVVIARNELKDACEQLASMSTTMNHGGLFQAFKGFIPKITSAFKAATALSQTPNYEGITSDHKRFVELLNKHSYAELRNLKAVRPTGLAVPFLTYLQTLDVAVHHALAFKSETLDVYTMFLAKLTSTKDALICTDERKLFTKIEKGRADVEAEFAKQFKTTDNTTDTKLAAVVDRNADWIDVFGQMDQVRRTLDRINLKDIELTVSHANDYLEVVYHQIKNGEIKNMSDEVIRQLSDGAYQVACEVEFLSLIYYRVVTLEVAIKDTREGVIKALS